MAADDLAAPPGRGRPKSVQLDEAILEAACGVLAEQGYSGFSFEAVAKASGTTRPAIYRRWKRREDLLLAALDHIMHVNPAPGEERPWIDPPGEVTDQALLAMLHEMVANFARILSDPRANAVGISVSAATYGDPGVRDIVQAHHYDRRKPLEALLGLAQRRGILRDDISLDDLLHILIGSVQYRASMLQESITEAYAQQVLKVLLRPACSRPKEEAV